MKEVLAKLEVGSSVAEFDAHLQSYFIETQIYQNFVNDRHDIVSGAKGAGKSAIYRVVKARYRTVGEISDVEVVSGFNDTGNPIFQRLTQSRTLSEGQYITVWKAYLAALAGNYVLDVVESGFSDDTRRLDALLRHTGLRSEDIGAQTIFSRLANLVRKYTNPSATEHSLSFTEHGIPVIGTRLEFAEVSDAVVDGEQIETETILNVLNRCLIGLDLRIWVVLDRLDEAFAGYAEVEIPALRALLRTYLDLQSYDHIRLKMFLRSDLFRRVVRGGFVNMTHVNAKRVNIEWSAEDLKSLLCNRIRSSLQFLDALSLPTDAPDELILERLFPNKIDVGEKRPDTWGWITTRIADGNGLMSPRNLIDLINKAKEYQAKREEREPREYAGSEPILESDAIKRALIALSTLRVEDTLLAESDHLAAHIERFRNGKAEHNLASLHQVLRLEGDELAEVIEELKFIGFLYETGASYKIPMLYRGGLSITQGKAF
ncbi:P-loop ATPase, Sll1717 family [Luteimonas saliphila]|uniref:P-loop ATPase, Sll1717 family n=1 Tax=Luteimonas saliphila TaxID=2804919 RepID=UPI001EE3895B|nr:hypothetical protein [Luteimonas saliphila]